MTELTRRRQFALDAVAQVARTLPPILKDHNLAHTAKELDEKLFTLEVIEQEMTTFIGENAAAVIEALLGKLP